MGVVIIAALASTIQGNINGTASVISTIISLFTAVAMLVGIVLFPIFNTKYDEKYKEKYLQKRKERYTNYLAQKTEEINQIKTDTKDFLYDNYPSSDECAQIITTQLPRLWERELEDKDFLSIRLGIGNIPFDIDISYPEKGFSMEDDKLLDELNTVIEESKVIKNVPVTLSLRKNKITSIISKDEDYVIKYIKNIIVQLVALHSYIDLKLVMLLDNDISYKWENIKMLPHLWDASKKSDFLLITMMK